MGPLGAQVRRALCFNPGGGDDGGLSFIAGRDLCTGPGCICIGLGRRDYCP